MLNVDAITEIVESHGFQVDETPKILEAMIVLVARLHEVCPTACDAIAHLCVVRPADKFQAVVLDVAVESLHQVLACDMADSTFH